MVFPDLAANLIYTVLCLVPGFVTLKTTSYIANLDLELTEFEKSTWSLLGSGISISVLYFLYVVSMNIATGRLIFVRPLELGWVELVAIYPALLLVAVAVGFLCGGILARTRVLSTGVRAETGQ